MRLSRLLFRVGERDHERLHPAHVLDREIQGKATGPWPSVLEDILVEKFPLGTRLGGIRVGYFSGRSPVVLEWPTRDSRSHSLRRCILFTDAVDAALNRHQLYLPECL